MNEVFLLTLCSSPYMHTTRRTRTAHVLRRAMSDGAHRHSSLCTEHSTNVNCSYSVHCAVLRSTTHIHRPTAVQQQSNSTVQQG